MYRSSERRTKFVKTIGFLGVLYGSSLKTKGFLRDFYRLTRLPPPPRKNSYAMLGPFLSMSFMTFSCHKSTSVCQIDCNNVLNSVVEAYPIMNLYKNGTIDVTAPPQQQYKCGTMMYRATERGARGLRGLVIGEI